MSLKDRALELAGKYKWPAITGLGLTAVSGGIGYARRRFQRNKDEAYLQGLIQGQMQGMPRVQQAGLQKQAISLAPIGKAIGFGTAKAGAGLKWVGNKLNVGLQTAGAKLNNWGNAAGTYLKNKGYQNWGDRVARGGAALGRGTDWLRNQGAALRDSFNIGRGI